MGRRRGPIPGVYQHRPEERIEDAEDARGAERRTGDGVVVGRIRDDGAGRGRGAGPRPESDQWLR